MKKKKLTYFLARYISYIFVPPSFTFLIFVYVGLQNYTSGNKSIITILLGLLLGLILPIIFFSYLMKKGKVGDADATVKEERFLPYIFGIVISVFGMVLSYLFKLEVLVLILWFIYLANMLLLLVINKYWKISAHAIGASIALGVLYYLQGAFSLVLFPLLLLISWSRIYLKKHTFMQVVAGAVVGFVLSVSLLNLLWRHYK